MNFFEHQQQARVSTRRLIVLFALAVIGVVLAVNAVTAFVLGSALYGVDRGVHVLVTLATLALIAAGTTWETLSLRSGGDAVAKMVGARPIDPGSRDLLERRLLNVVEEMALASGTPVPRVYLMDGEPGINAFAAGHTVNDAVVAVTRGTLTRLTRDELQGVVAHEFSHILNGDMRLNVRLISVLFGLTMVSMVGRFMLEASGRSRDTKGLAPLVIVGLALWVIGYVGVLFGRIIKASVSRQREYLADASAVQFTRNPDGIGSALRKIGGLSATADFAQAGGTLGTEIQHPHAETLSHLFLGAARANFASGMLATHPPLADRIRRIYGRAMGVMNAPEQPLAIALAGTAAADAAPAADALKALSPLAGFGLGAQPLADTIGQATPQPQAQPYVESWRDRVRALGLDTALRDSAQAQLLVLSMLVDKRSDVGATQRQAVSEALGAPAAAVTDRLHATVQSLPPGARLPLLDMTMPALRKLPLTEADRLLRIAHQLIAADGRMTLPEFLLFTVLKRRLGSAAQASVPPRHASVAELPEEAARVLSLLAHLRTSRSAEQAFEAGRAALGGLALTRTPASALTVEALGEALDRLNRLMPLAKPAFIKGCAAVVYEEGRASIDWQAASALRTICAALDSPMPPLVLDAADRVH
jgi:Zn-dependent protease with chaperone function